MSDRPKDPRAEARPAKVPTERVSLEPAPTAEELVAAERLRDALESASPADEHDDLAFIGALRAAWSPDPIDDRAHAEMLGDLPASAEEIEGAARLRETLDDDALVTALRAAWDPAPLAANANRDLVAKALAEPAKVIPLRPQRRQARSVLAVTATVLALAAGVALWISNTSQQTIAPMARARSTQPLFDEPFKAGEASARIDRIAIARASDYRANRFAQWGVR